MQYVAKAAKRFSTRLPTHPLVNGGADTGLLLINNVYTSALNAARRP